MRYRRGFTLVELLVTMAVALILMAGLYQFFVAQQRTYSTQDEVLRLQQEARMAEDLMVKAIQQTGAFAPTVGTTVSMRGQVILAASDHYLTLQYDDPYRGSDKGVVTAPEIVTYALSKPSGAATERVGDDPAVAKASRTVRAYFDADGDGEVEATEAFDLEIPLALSGPPYTLYRITPDDTGTPKFEAVAARVENLVFRYYDHNGNPIPSNPTPPYVLDETERARVRSIEIELTLKTRNEDPRYSAAFVYPAGTVGSYDASGDPSGTDVTVTDGYRRRTFTTRVTPRNLYANTCGRLTINADPTNPACPASSDVKVNVTDQYGDPVAGAEVIFSLPAASGASFVSGGSALSATATTDSNGDASVTVYYTGTAKTIAVSAQAVVDCRPTGPASFTLINSVPIGFVPGLSKSVTVTPPSADEIYTCQNPQTFTFVARAYDACGNEVDPQPGVVFTALDASSGTPFGTVEGSVSGSGAFEQSGETFTVTPDTTAPTNIDVQILTPPAWLSSVTGLPFGSPVTLIPWPPSKISWLTTNFSSTPFTDCPSDAATDWVGVTDCVDNPIPDLAPPGYDPRYRLRAWVEPDGAVVDPADHGTLESVSADVVSGPTELFMTQAQAAGDRFDITYQPPLCTIPPGSLTKHPSIRVALEKNEAGSFAPLTPPVDIDQTLNLDFCADCSVEFQEDPTPCTQKIPVEISGCNFQGNETVEVEVTWSGLGTAYWDPTVSTTTNFTHKFAAGETSFTTDLYIENQISGDTYTVTAYYPNKSKARWSCQATVTVETRCEKLNLYTIYTSSEDCSKTFGEKIGTDNGRNVCRRDASTAPIDQCSANALELAVEVDDCQAATGPIIGAVEIWTEVNGVRYDTETMDLEWDNTDKLFKQIPLPIQTTGTYGYLPFKGAHDPPVDGDDVLTYPPGSPVLVRAKYTDPVDSNDTCSAAARFAPALPICFPNAITSGGGGSWDGNFKVHWGDVVIRGDVELASTPKFIEKSATAALNGNKYTGSKNSDRFFDLYAGKTVDGSGGNFIQRSGAPVPNSNPDDLDRPFLAGNEGDFLGDIYGNYFRNISYEKISEMLRELDYDTMKALAQQRGVYWYTLPGGQLRNPATNVTVSDLQTLLDLPGPGLPNAYHDGEYIFIDTFGTTTAPPSKTGAEIDSAALTDLPSFRLGNNFYTEGVIYIAGSVDFAGGGGGFNLNVKTPPELDTEYGYVLDPAFPITEDDLPIRPDPGGDRHAVTLSSININGGIYLDGAAEFSGSPSIFGAITAERGYSGNGTPEIWYNYTLNQSGENEELCIACCTLEISPSVVAIDLGDTLGLTALNADGTVQWTSENSAIASVNASGLVTAKAIGVTRIKAVDANNCFAWATIEVTDPCDRMTISPQNPSIATGDMQSFAVLNTPAGVTFEWSSSDTSVATIDPAVGIAHGVGKGTAVITATETSGTCPGWTDDTLLSVNCGLYISSAPASVTVGDDIVLTATGGYGTVTWTPDDDTLVDPDSDTGDSVSFTSAAAGTVTFTATDDAGCADTATVQINAIPCTLEVNVTGDSTIHVRETTTVEARFNTGTVSWTASPATVGSVSPGTGLTTTVTGLSDGTLTVTASDGGVPGCTDSVDITVLPATCSVAASDDFDNGSLDTAWTSQDIGSPGKPGSVAESGGTLSVEGGGADIWGTSDQFHFVYRTGLTASDDFVVTVKVLSVENTNPWAKAGIMVRDSLDPDAAFVDLFATPTNKNQRLQGRLTAGGSATGTGDTLSVAFPYWLRLRKVGNTFTAYYSTDGTTFSQYMNGGSPASLTVPMSGDVYVGLAVTAHHNNKLATAKFDDFSIDCP
ncbi:Ig-like domain-containing protein [Deferrisoma sp.]